MTSRRAFIQAAGLAAAFLTVSGARAQRRAALPAVRVYKNRACGCCGGWVAHMQANGFGVDVSDVDDVSPIKTRLKVPEALWSCHTAVVDGYAIEGHVPAADVQRLLRERPKVRGLAVPGMVPGSPGMDGPPQRYVTLAFGEAGNRPFESH